MITFLIRVGAAVVEAYHAATVIAAEAVLSAVADLAEYLPGDNAEQRLGALGLACVGAQASPPRSPSWRSPLESACDHNPHRP